MNNFKIKIYKEFSDELELLWKDFEKKSDNYYFQTFQWQKYWFKQMKKYKKNSISAHIVIIENDNGILFILPMYINKFSYFHILSWSGFPFSDYNAPLIKKNLNINKEEFLDVWKLVLKSGNKLFNCVNLNNQPQKINQIFNPFFKFLNIISTTSYFGITLEKIINGESSLNNSQISDINYQTKRLNKKGNLVFNIAKNKNDVKNILKFIIKHKTDQYRNTNAWNLFEIDAYKKFFIQCNLNLSSNLYLTYLSLDKNIIAAHSGYIHNNTCYYLFPAYDINFKKYSPGKILLNNLVEDCKKKKLDYFDFTIGSENYKNKWSNNKMSSCTTLKSVNLIGFFYVIVIKIKILFKSINIKNKFLNNIYNKFKKSAD